MGTQIRCKALQKGGRGKKGKGWRKRAGGQIGGAGKGATSSAKLQFTNIVPAVSEINHGHWIHYLP